MRWAHTQFLDNEPMFSCIRELIQGSTLAQSEAKILAAHALGVPRSWLVAHDTDTLSAPQISAITQCFQRRMAGEPVAYIQGFREFYGLNFVVNPSVLIPRPETELLLDWLIKNCPQGASVLDLGTGSGAIGVTLAHHRPDLIVTACDISPAALAVAAQNNVALAAGRVKLIASDWFERTLGRFDVIVSNPPYIAAGDVHLSQGDLRFEPAGALTDRADGLSHYRTIITESLTRLKPAGWLVLEHGYDQSAALQMRLREAGYANIKQYYDAAIASEQGMSRMLVAQAVF